ncbi:hypothetical protein K461DRAFT_222230 [Myriangium duriaei CBS 260.36]|uniref:Uncharacterized protein n=1 Tax=Myriangium duriaei CBS 260.36 TaxID=1168546 RepID=A0A9P4J345_9PEZI|nr:hypothetical protein K461DRAFT_222230 [Myriangium duriaei CBS 260.36]
MTGGLSLFDLPVEIRYHVYQFLIPDGLRILPVPHVDIASVTRRPPNTNLLLANKAFHDDIFDYFMIHATWKINVQYSFNFFRVDPELSGLANWRLLPHVRKAEILVTLDLRLMQEYPSLGLEAYCVALRQRAMVASQALSRCHDLQKLVISFKDTTIISDWETKKTIMEPLLLHLLPGVICVGTLSGVDSVNLRAFLTDTSLA